VSSRPSPWTSSVALDSPWTSAAPAALLEGGGGDRNTPAGSSDPLCASLCEIHAVAQGAKH
jgi:hypothetical protein